MKEGGRKKEKGIGVILASFFVILFSFFLLPSSVEASLIPKAPNNLGLVGYWSFEDGAGDHATDFSGKGNTGTLTSMDPATDWVSGKIGTTLDFDGSDYVEVQSTQQINDWSDSGNSITVSAWLKANNFTAAARIVSKMHSINNQALYNFLVNTSGQAAFGVSDGSATDTYTTTSHTLTAGNWYHLVYVHTYGDGSSSKVYVNGELATGAWGTDGNRTVDSTNANHLRIGHIQHSSVPTGTDGSIDDVRIYNRALSPTEVAALYDRTGQTVRKNSSRGLIGHWTFDEGSGTVTADKTGQGNNGTLTSMEQSDWVDGKFGKALEFDGGEHVAATPSIGATATFSAWATWSGTSEKMLFALGTGNPGPDLFFTSGKIAWNIYDSSANSFGNIPASASDGNWHHYVVVVQSGTGNTKLYYDGELLGTATYRDPTHTILQVGGHASYRWTGKIDDFRIYDRALSAQEITNLYNSSGEALGVLNRGHRDALTDGLVAYHSFDGPLLNTTTSTDSTANGNDGTLTGGPVPALGRLGQALRFDGVDDYVDLGSSFSPSIPITLSAWINASVVTGAYRPIIHKYSGSGMWFGIDPEGNVYAESICSSFQTVAIVTANIWTHVAITCNSNNPIIYINGASAATASGSSISGNGNLQIGKYSGGSFNGSIDDVRVYNRALSAEEVLQLYNMGR